MKIGIDRIIKYDSDELIVPEDEQSMFDHYNKDIELDLVGVDLDGSGNLIITLKHPNHKYLNFSMGGWGGYDYLQLEGEEPSPCPGMCARWIDIESPHKYRLASRDCATTHPIQSLRMMIVAESEAENSDFLTNADLITTSLKYATVLKLVPELHDEPQSLLDGDETGLMTTDEVVYFDLKP